MMTKNDVYVVVDTPKKAKKLKKLLDMFGEKLNRVDVDAIKISHYNGSAKLYTEYNKSYFNGINWTLMDICEDKTEVSIKQLRNILAKEHLKVGDYVVLKNGLMGKIISLFGYSEMLVWDSKNDKVTFLIEDFKRYATPEEIELLEGKKELEVGKWYKHPNNKYPNWLVYYGGNKKCYGFRTSGVWDYDYKNEWFEYLNAYPMVEATPQQVESALIREAKRRYKVGDKLKDLEFGLGVVDFKNVRYYHDDNELWISSKNCNIKVFDNGKWAEVAEEIKDSDIAIIEALHDVLLDNHKYDFNSKLLANARELCKKLHNIVGD